ncbi:NAD/NADP octopine/nopaline dehydrogenase family protein [Phocaeicola vulgatus]|nr:NAD/NADP octopine/nopaline dehydrogenase family protein [Phocaeicola vulgatus]
MQGHLPARYAPSLPSNIFQLLWKKQKKGFLPDFKSRYFTEDFPFGLLIIKSIAEVLNICTPNIDKILLWGQDVLNKEYIHEGELKGKDLSKTGYINADLFYKLLKN